MRDGIQLMANVLKWDHVTRPKGWGTKEPPAPITLASSITPGYAEAKN